ncbi:MAG TPA: efflux transporter outer membrane subunit [Phenylobacterium sp.]|uniref:efflux transporter outer membrane subunit n=1 Tax=Phenylobacterium sp. TaxID=1871053 RepID=UPI002CCA52AA|nr:efflux transporter outer membrane subunit [Phenylobacterium sp.]HSV02482.1 efflux transporter outer membrane subunit [Phenylobacterium sp.]
MRLRLIRPPLAVLTAAGLAGCMVGPNYHRPALPLAPAYKEQGWSPAQPAELDPRGDWWSLFNDPGLSALEARVAVTNQNVVAAEAAYRQAEALVAEQRAGLLPTISLDGGVTRSGGGRGGGGTVITQGAGGTGIVASGGGRSATNYRVSASASWAPDIWGRIRRSIESARGNAQASQADLAAATLSAQATLAADYFDLRELDAEAALLREEVAGFAKSLQIAQNRYNAGIAPHSDALQAQSQLASTQADLADLERRRAAFEHAIAVLTGQTPEAFALAAEPTWTPSIPGAPAGVPSQLLQRRPDVAAAERRAASASAQIGVETAAYFPDLTLTGTYGFSATELGKLFSASNNFWSYGASLAETVFNGGLTHARVRAARANYDRAVAQYRQAVLAALQDVEDQLAASRVLASEYDLRRQAAADADLAATMVLNQYREGQVAYTNVVTAQVQALNARRTLLQAALSRQTTAVALVQGLGGGWTSPF